jgi:hypothetical protein
MLVFWATNRMNNIDEEIGGQWVRWVCDLGLELVRDFSMSYDNAYIIQCKQNE